MTLPFTHPWLLAPFGAAAALTVALALRAHQRPGHGVQVVGQQPLGLGLGLALVWAGLGLGLAEPRWGLPEYPRLTVHVVLDASRSMTVVDAQGHSRWEAAVAALDRIWSRPQPGIRWSLDLLTGDAVPVHPPGEDRTLLREALRAVAPGAIGSPGTSMGRGLPQVTAQVEPGSPAMILLLGDGEETWEAPEEALRRATAVLVKAKLPVCVMAFGDGQPHALPPPGEPEVANPPQEPLLSRARPDWLARLAQATGGRVFADGETAALGIQATASGQLPLPARRSLQPAHPEVGAWLALAGLALWLFSAGNPMARWRPILVLLVMAGGPLLLAGGPPRAPWAPPSARAWLAERALEAGNLAEAQGWRPRDARPYHLLLAAQIDLKAGTPEAALSTLGPLLSQGAPHPLPSWRLPALMMAARAHLVAGRPAEARELLERILLEQPGQRDAIQDLQTLVKDPGPPPPRPPKPPPPPPPRPSLGAQRDELEGLRQRLPKPPRTAGGVKDL